MLVAVFEIKTLVLNLDLIMYIFNTSTMQHTSCFHYGREQLLCFENNSFCVPQYKGHSHFSQHQSELTDAFYLLPTICKKLKY